MFLNLAVTAGVLVIIFMIIGVFLCRTDTDTIWPVVVGIVFAAFFMLFTIAAAINGEFTEYKECDYLCYVCNRMHKAISKDINKINISPKIEVYVCDSCYQKLKKIKEEE